VAAPRRTRGGSAIRRSGHRPAAPRIGPRAGQPRRPSAADGGHLGAPRTGGALRRGAGARPAELADDPPADAAVALTTSLAQALAGRGRATEACRLLEARAAGATVEHRARLIGSLASVRLTNGEADAARRDAEEAVAAATAAGDDHWLRSTFAVQAWLAVGDGDPDSGIELANRSLPSGVDDKDPSQSVFGRVPLGVALLEADRFEPAAASFRRAIEVGDRTGASGNATLAHLGLALSDYAAGRLDEAVAGAETALVLAQVGGNRSGDLYAHALLARIALHRHGVATAAPLVEAARARLDETGPALGAEAVVWVAALANEASGPPVDTDMPLLAWQLHPMRYLLTWRLIAPDLVRWLVAAGRLDEAGAVVADVEAVAGTSPGRRSVAAQCRATITGRAPGPRAFRSPRPIEVAAAHVMAARAQLDPRADTDRGAALASLQAALALASSVGAVADAEAIFDLARRSKLRIEAPVRTVGPPDALTAAERSVAALAAEGLTNRAIGAGLAMSRHTVDTHLRHIYRKLGVKGRVELARHRPHT